MATIITQDDAKAYITNVEDKGCDRILVDWECGGPADRVTSDFAWPGKIIADDGYARLNRGWLILEDANLKPGDTVPLLEPQS